MVLKQNANLIDYGSTQYRRNIRRFVRLLAQKGAIKGRVLDVGCGRRNHLPEISMSSRIIEYKTLDSNATISPDYCTSAATMEGVPLSYFDTIICTEVLEHYANPTAIVEGIYRVGGPKSLLILTVPFWKAIHQTPSLNDYFRFTPSGLSEIVRGFYDGRIDGVGANILRPLGVFALLERLDRSGI